MRPGRTEKISISLGRTELALMRKRDDGVLAHLAGEALATIAGAGVVDAIVMATAAQRGDIVYTSDGGDMQRLQAYVPTVTVPTV
jgi:hypothetical protein